jgi:hypothetical protein
MVGGAAKRDELTRERLEAAAAHLTGMQVLAFRGDWWDGQSHTPCLVVRGGRRGRRQRVVETAGEAVIVPFARRQAGRWLAARRRPRPIELVVPAQRRPDDVVVEVEVETDVVRCRTDRCGALLLVGYEGDCPICGS